MSSNFSKEDKFLRELSLNEQRSFAKINDSLKVAIFELSHFFTFKFCFINNQYDKVRIKLKRNDLEIALFLNFVKKISKKLSLDLRAIVIQTDNDTTISLYTKEHLGQEILENK